MKVKVVIELTAESDDVDNIRKDMLTWCNIENTGFNQINNTFLSDFSLAGIHNFGQSID